MSSQAHMSETKGKKKQHPQESLTRLLAVILTGIVCFLLLGILWPSHSSFPALAVRFAGITVAGLVLYRFLTRQIRRRAFVRQQPFPAEWERILEQEVPFYTRLSPADQRRRGYAYFPS